MQIHHACRQLSILFGRWRIVFMFAFAPRRVVKSPMLDVTLATLHHSAVDTSIPAFAICAGVSFRKMQICIRHSQFLAYATEAKLAIGLFKRKWMSRRCFFSIQEPFIHTPEMR